MSDMKAGEVRHEQCRYGRLTEGFHIDMAGKSTPMILPLCMFQPSAPVPPALNRIWSGSIEYDRDCAVCPAFEAL